MHPTRLDAALAGLPLGAVRFLERTGSTNDDAERWAAEGAPDLALLVADEQTEGRGRLGRRWYTPPGAALAFSLVLRPDWLDQVSEMPARLMQVTALGALGICAAIENLYGLRAEIKWPNDVLLGGRKVAGILAETHWSGNTPEAMILGLGMNVSLAAVPDDEESIFPATCLEAAVRKDVDRMELLRAVLAGILHWREQVGSMGFLHAWDGRLAFKGEWVQVHTLLDNTAGTGQSPHVREGQVLGLDAQGCLRLRDRSRRGFKVCTGEVRVRKL